MALMKKSVILAVVLVSLTATNQRSADARSLDSYRKLHPQESVSNHSSSQSEPTNQLTDNDIRCLEAVIYNETSGNRAHGAILVGAAVFNRVESDLYPDTICEVAYQRAQFTNIHRVKPHHINEQTREVVREIIEKHYNGTLNEHVMYFHNTSVIPKWSHKKRFVARVGEHLFYAR